MPGGRAVATGDVTGGGNRAPAPPGFAVAPDPAAPAPTAAKPLDPAKATPTAGPPAAAAGRSAPAPTASAPPAPDLAAIAAAAAAERLFISGTLPLEPSEVPGCRGLVLLSPEEPGHWPHLLAQPELQDGAPDPIDRWSARVIGALARRFGASAVFPFGGPPWHPFLSWAFRSGRTFRSPVTLGVHDRMGLWASWRGALAFAAPLAATPAANPCETCPDKPCLSACPARALTARGYDVAACHAWLDRPEGAENMQNGCAVRRSCPVSARYGRLADESAYHMRQFHR